MKINKISVISILLSTLCAVCYLYYKYVTLPESYWDNLYSKRLKVEPKDDVLKKRFPIDTFPTLKLGTQDSGFFSQSHSDYIKAACKTEIVVDFIPKLLVIYAENNSIAQEIDISAERVTPMILHFSTKQLIEKKEKEGVKTFKVVVYEHDIKSKLRGSSNVFSLESQKTLIVRVESKYSKEQYELAKKQFKAMMEEANKKLMEKRK